MSQFWKKGPTEGQDGQSSPRLRLVSADRAEHDSESLDVSPAMSLMAFWRRFLRPVIWEISRKADKKTLVEYEKSLEYWTLFTGDPPLQAIDDRTLAHFLAGLRTIPGRAPVGQSKPASEYTIVKHIGNIQACLHHAGPWSREYPKAQELLKRVPMLERPSLDPHEDSDGRADEFYTLEEMAAILRGAELMASPRVGLVPPPDWWRSLVSVAYNTAERKFALLHVRFADLDGRKLRFPRSIRKGKRKSNVIQLNDAAMAAIDKIRGPREFIFGWPHCPRYFDTCRERLLKLAGIPRERWFGMHAFRRTAATAIGLADPLAAQWLLGHADFKTTNDHYLGGKKQRVAQALAALPQPQWLPPVTPAIIDPPAAPT